MMLSIKELDRITWDLFSIYIRLRDCNEQGIGFCCTCHKPMYWLYADAGHYENRACKLIKYDIRNVHLQCKFDNRLREGMKDRYSDFIVAKYGNKVKQELNMKAKKFHKITAFELIAIFNTYYREIKDTQLLDAQKRIKALVKRFEKAGGTINNNLTIS